MNRVLFVSTVLILAIINTTYCQSECQAFGQGSSSGQCIPIRQCPHLLSMALKPNFEVIRLLLRNRCDPIRRNYLCCAIETTTNAATTEITDETITEFEDTTRNGRDITAQPTTEDPNSTTENNSDNQTTNPTQPNCFLNSSLVPGSDVCGLTPFIPRRIVGGGPVLSPTHFPWLVALYYKPPEEPELTVYSCVGTIINERWILTAAHCILNPDIGSLNHGRLGDLNLITSVDDNEQTTNIGIIKQVIHPEYRKTSDRVNINDIALLKTNQTIEFSNIIKPICLPTNCLEEEEFKNQMSVISGWGTTEFAGDFSPLLQMAEVRISLFDVCNEKFNGILDRNHVCANGPDEMDTCQGDSGTPLIIPYQRDRLLRNGQTQWKMLAVSSFGIGCGNQQFPGVYNRIDTYLSWINSVLTEDTLS